MDIHYEFSETENTCKLLENGILLECFRPCDQMEQVDESAELFGNSAEDAKVWSPADSVFSDSVMCEKYILETLCDDHSSVGTIIASLVPQGHFDRDYGCTQADIGKSLEAHGLEVWRESDLSIKDLCESLENNEKIICSISSIALHFPDMRDMPGLCADRYVELIGIDKTDTANQKVILNDPCTKGGVALELERFESAWRIGGGYAVLVNRK